MRWRRVIDGAVLGLLVAASLAGCGSSAPATGNPTGPAEAPAHTSAHPNAGGSPSAASAGTRNPGSPGTGVTAPAGAQGAAALAHKLGCTDVETRKPKKTSRAVSLAKCQPGNNEVLIVTFASTSDLEVALHKLEQRLRSADDRRGKLFAARGPNWLAFGSREGADRPTRAVAKQIAAKLGGKVIAK